MAFFSSNLGQVRKCRHSDWYLVPSRRTGVRGSAQIVVPLLCTASYLLAFESPSCFCVRTPFDVKLSQVG